MKLLTAVILLLMPFLAAAQTYEESFTDISDIQLSTGSGNCIIQKSSDDQVTVRLEHEMGAGYTPSVEQRGERLFIKDNPDKGHIHGAMNYTISVPNDMSFAFNAGSGNLKANGIQIELKSNSGSGNISFENMKGSIKANTGSGNIKLSDFDGEVKVNAGSGNSDIQDFTGELSVNCGSGNINIAGANASISANAGSGTIDGKNVVITGESGFNVGSGNARLQLAEAPGFDISVNSGSGNASLDLKDSDFKGTVVMTANKRNGKIVAPYTFDKEEEIDEGGTTKIRKTVSLGNSDVLIKISTGTGTSLVKE